MARPTNNRAAQQQQQHVVTIGAGEAEQAARRIIVAVARWRQRRGKDGPGEPVRVSRDLTWQIVMD